LITTFAIVLFYVRSHETTLKRSRYGRIRRRAGRATSRRVWIRHNEKSNAVGTSVSVIARLVRKLRKAGVHPVVISGVVGHKSVELAGEVYDRADRNDIRQGLGVMVRTLLPKVLPSQSVN
jgi:hypothetical protein